MGARALGMGCAVTGSAGGVQRWPALQEEHSRERTGQTPGLGRAQAALPPRHVVGIRNDDQLGVGDDGGPLLLPHRLQGGGKAQRLVPCTLALRRVLSGSVEPWAREAVSMYAAPRQGSWCCGTMCATSQGRTAFPPPGCVPSTNIIYARQSLLPGLRTEAAWGSERRGSDKHVRL